MKLILLAVAAACTTATATAHEPMRAVYIHPGPFESSSESDAERDALAADAVERMVAAGFNTLFPYANTSNGYAHYASGMLPSTNTGDWDALAAFTREARARDIQVMPSVCVLVSGHDEPAGILEQHPEWALRDIDGEPLGWISPAHPDARRWVVSMLVEVAEHIEPDGILLDYVRFPNKPVRLDPESEARFDAAAPDGETEQARATRLQRFREDSLTELMGEVYRALQERQPGLTLALYSWGAHVAKNHHVAQRWPDWVALGYIDCVNVSGYCYRENYGDNYLTVFERRMADAREQLLLAGSGASLSFALGLRTSHGAIPEADEVADYIAIAESVGVEGVAAFSWTSLEPFLPALTESQVIAEAFPKSERVHLLEVKATVEFGRDEGQNLGSLFDAWNENNESIAGMGFLGAYNTYFQADRHMLHAFVRPPGSETVASISPMPRPSPHVHHYMFDAGDDVYATDRGSPARVYHWNPDEDAWSETDPSTAPSIPVGNHRLELHRNRIVMEGHEVFTFDASIGTAGSYYYAHGHLFFHVAAADSPERQTFLYACAWHPDDGNAVSIDDAIVLPLTAPGEFPYSYGQHRPALPRTAGWTEPGVIVGTNNGGVYRFRDGAWATLRAADPRTSFQLYTMINHYNRLLMGHYPSGELYEIVEDEVRHLVGSPPRPDTATPSAREVQSLTIYRGELFVGIWPWGEVWQMAAKPGESQDWEEDWHFIGRLFSHPEMLPSVTAPYEAELSALGEAVNNLWGQRVTSLIPHRDGLLASTSNKNGTPMKEDLAFLAEDRWKEYGAVHRLHLPGHVSIPIEWKDGPTEFMLVILPDRFAVRQDGRLLAVVPLLAEEMEGFAAQGVDWGTGVFGLFGGSTVEIEAVL